MCINRKLDRLDEYSGDLLQGMLIIIECAQIYGQNVSKYVAPAQTPIWYINNRRGLSASYCTKTTPCLPPPWGYVGSP